MKNSKSRKLGLENLETRNLLAVTPVISEFMAVNDSTLADQDGDFSDWIEIHNSTAAPVNLDGWHLTDDSGDSTKWTFPSKTLAADEYLVVFASDKNRRDPASELHTNFKLSGGGEYLALNQPDGTPVEFAFAPEYPSQTADISYGLSLDESQVVYYSQPTPGAANTGTAIGYTGEVKFSVPHGYYTDTFLLHLSTEQPDEVIRYTLDGSKPSATTGTVYSSPIMIDGTSTVRSAAFKSGFQTDNVETATYIFVDETVSLTNQGAYAKGFPTSYGLGGGPTNYGLSQAVIGQNAFGGVYANSIEDDLVAIPTMSIVTDFDHLFDNQTGIMDNPLGRGVAWERPTSIEVIHPDNLDAGTQVDAGIRVQGGISRQISKKLSLRLLFKEQYGATKLEHSLFGENKSSSFDSLVLRGGMGEQFVGLHYIRDRFLRTLQEASGSISTTGEFMHLYVNGVYWGMYDAVERPDETHHASYYGGDKNEWDVLNAGDLGNQQVTAIAGTTAAWFTLESLTRDVRDAATQTAKSAAFYRLQGLNPDGTDNPSFEKFLDVDNYIDYLSVSVFTGNDDWPHRNYYMARQRGLESDGFKFQTWDAEFSLDAGTFRRVTQLENVGPLTLFHNMKTSEEFRVRFADRVQKMVDPQGILHTTAGDPDHEAVEVYTEIANTVASPLVAESARWFGEGFGGPAFTVNEVFQPKVAQNTNIIRNRRSSFLSQTASVDFYRQAPEFSQDSGTVGSGTSVTLSSSTGDIYYTLDGSDPRLPGGAVSPAAQLYTTPIVVTDRAHVTTRSVNGTTWSGGSSRLYLVGSEIASSANLAISEINYHPHDANPQFGELDVAASEFEFVELSNRGALPIDLTGIKIQDGIGLPIAFEFGVQSLAPGAQVVIPANPAAFASRYGASANLAVGTQSTSSEWRLERGLSNGGQLLTVQALDSSQVQQFRYEDSGDWPERADGNASSLEVIDVNGDYADPDNWRSSSEFGGSPGYVGTGPDNRIVINEVLTNSSAPTVDSVELYNTTGGAIDIHNWYVSDKSSNYFQYQVSATEVIGSDSYLVLDQTELGFGLNSVSGDDVYLIEADASGVPLRFVDRVSFDATDTGTTLGRWGNGEGRLFPMTNSTLGAVNSGPEYGEFMITEFSFHPDQSPEHEREWEFVELTNISGSAADLSGYRLRGELDYDFDQSLVLQPNQSIVVLGFDPDSMTSWTQAFRNAYSDATTAVLVGEFDQAAALMDNDDGRITLTRSGTPAGGETPFYLVDEVNYDKAWGNASGNGNSFERNSSQAYGDFTASWIAGTPTPGMFVDSTVDPDFNSDGILNCDDINALTAAVAGASPDLSFDLNADGGVTFDDVTMWLQLAGQTNLASGNSYLMGDANLDGSVDVSDFNIWNSNKFTNNTEWCSGNFDADGFVDVSDFNIWNSSKFTTADRLAVVEVTPQAAGEIAVGAASSTFELQHSSDREADRTIQKRQSIVEQVFGTWA